MTGFAYEEKENITKIEIRAYVDNYITQKKTSDRSLVVKQEL